MTTLSATEAITPAWHYTKQLLFTPRRWRLLLKIGAVAFFAQMGGGLNGNFSTPGRHMHGVPNEISAMLWPILLAIGLASLVIGLVLLYIGSRLQFVLFEVVLRHDTTVAPIWSRYGSATWRWIGLKLLYFLLAFLCLSPLLIPAIIYFVRYFRSVGDGPPEHLAGFFVTIAFFVLALFVAILIISCGYVLLADFGLPSLALEGTPIRETVRRVWNLLRADTGQVLLYLLMRFILGLVAAFILEFGLALLCLIALIPLGGLAAVLWFSLHHGGLAGHILMIAGWVVLGVIFLIAFFIAAIISFGYFFTFLEAYALLFLGGRYPMVGQYLDWFLVPPPQPIPPPAYPPYNSPPLPSA